MSTAARNSHIAEANMVVEVEKVLMTHATVRFTDAEVAELVAVEAQRRLGCRGRWTVNSRRQSNGQFVVDLTHEEPIAGLLGVG